MPKDTLICNRKSPRKRLVMTCMHQSTLANSVAKTSHLELLNRDSTMLNRVQKNVRLQPSQPPVLRSPFLTVLVCFCFEAISSWTESRSRKQEGNKPKLTQTRKRAKVIRTNVCFSCCRNELV